MTSSGISACLLDEGKTVLCRQQFSVIGAFCNDNKRITRKGFQSGRFILGIASFHTWTVAYGFAQFSLRTLMTSCSKGKSLNNKACC
jgi:hypothetical protein